MIEGMKERKTLKQTFFLSLFSLSLVRLLLLSFSLQCQISTPYPFSAFYPYPLSHICLSFPISAGDNVKLHSQQRIYIYICNKADMGIILTIRERENDFEEENIHFPLYISPSPYIIALPSPSHLTHTCSKAIILYIYYIYILI